jgi:hypothetical protein
MGSDAMKDYYNALERLIKGRPQVIPVGTKITNDAVSLEAGRAKGSIKKSRPGFADLVASIDRAASVEVNPKVDEVLRVNRMKNETNKLQAKLDAALARELSLVNELLDAKRRLSALTGEKVLPIRRPKLPPK